MLTRLLQFSLSQRLFMLLLVAAVAAGGWLAFTKLPIDAFPEVSPVQVKIVFKAPGMTPEEVETRISVPIEVEMLGIPHQESLRSTNKYGIADITLKFADGTDIYWARQQVAERLNNIMGDLPAGMTGGITPITTPLGEIFMFTIERRGRCQCAGWRGPRSGSRSRLAEDGCQRGDAGSAAAGDCRQ